MPTATVKYTAPKGDSKVCEMFGKTFYDGKADEYDLDEREIGKLENNPHFEVGGVKSGPDPKPDPDDKKHK